MSGLSSLRTMEDWNNEYEEAKYYAENDRFMRMYVSLSDDERISLTAGRYLLSVLLARPYCQMGISPSLDRVLVDKQLTSRTLKDHLSEITNDLIDKGNDPINVSEEISFIIKEMTKIGTQTTSKVGNSISLRDLLDAAEQEPEIEELLFRWEIPENSEFHQIESRLKEDRERLVELILKTNTDIARLVRSGGAVNIDQLGQALLCVGPKPNLMGNVIPEPISTSYLRGMRSVQDFYISAEAARKAQVMNYNQVRVSGYLGRKMVLMVMEHDLGTTPKCNTPPHQGIFIKEIEKETAERLAGRTIYLVEYDEEGDANVKEDPIIPVKDEDGNIVGKNGEKVVGEDFMLASPITCSAEDGVCHTCYGHLSNLNQSIHAGILGVLYISEQLTQRLLSAKHMLKTNVQKIEWGDVFNNHFSIDKTIINVESKDLNAIGIEEDKLDGADEEYYTSEIILKKGDVKEKVSLPIPIHIQDINDWRSKSEGAHWMKVDTGSQPFYLSIVNSELADSLYGIFRIIENRTYDDVDELYIDFIKALEKGNIDTPSVHAEMILRAMVRSDENEMERPDFSNENAEYTILKVPQAILTSKSLSNSFAFERIKQQIKNPTIFNKTDSGLLDPLF